MKYFRLDHGIRILYEAFIYNIELDYHKTSWCKLVCS